MLSKLNMPISEVYHPDLLYDTMAVSVFAMCYGENSSACGAPIRRRKSSHNLLGGAAANMSGSIAALFQRLTQGVYVVGVAHGEKRNAFTAAWVMQVSYDPLLLALSINSNHSAYWLRKEGRSFSVNVLKKIS
jgi:hypothetical protein